MRDVFVWLVILGTPVLVLVAIVLRKRAERKRTAELSAMATALGLSFTPSGKGLLGEGFARLPLFERGLPRRASNVFRGIRGGIPTVVFDYLFMEGLGTRRGRMLQQTVAVFQLPGAAWPVVELEPGDLARGSERSRADDLFGRDVMEALGRERGWSLEAGRDWLVLYRAKSLVPPGDLREFVDEASAFAVKVRGSLARQGSSR